MRSGARRRLPLDVRHRLAVEARFPCRQMDAPQAIGPGARVRPEGDDVARLAGAVGELALVHVLAAPEIEHLVALAAGALERVAEQHGAGRNGGEIRIEARLNAEHAVAQAVAIRNGAQLGADLEAVKA